MCGRFALWHSPDDLQELFDLEASPDLRPRYNIAPSTPVLAMRVVDGKRRADLLRWGLVPHWAKEIETGYAMINARAETIDTAPSFRTAFRRRRCLIPADGFYEWQAQPDSKTKQPYFICRADGAPLAMAGLWERWKAPHRDDSVESCSIIVTAANKLLGPIHNRMPVLLDAETFATWLDPKNSDKDALKRLLRPYPGEGLQAIPVSRRVNNPSNDDPGLVERIGAGRSGWPGSITRSPVTDPG